VRDAALSISFESLLVASILLGILSLVSTLNALIEGRRPRIALFALFVTVALFVFAVNNSGDGLQPADIPYAFVQVIAALLNWAKL